MKAKNKSNDINTANWGIKKNNQTHKSNHNFEKPKTIQATFENKNNSNISKMKNETSNTDLKARVPDPPIVVKEKVSCLS